MKISAVIITHNEEKNIESAIRSLSWADEVLVVDSESTDRTTELAAGLGAVVISNPWPGFAEQKQLAADSAKYDWIFSLDADERVSDQLKAEVSGLVENGPNASGYRIPRLSIYMGRPIRHSGWYPDRQLRLFDRTKGRWSRRKIHESVEMDAHADVKGLTGEILHYSVENAVHHHRMIGERYAPLAAEQMHSEGRRTSPLRIAVSGPAAFTRSYLLKLGFLDGIPGLAIAGFAAHHAFLKHLLLWEKQNSPPEGKR